MCLSRRGGETAIVFQINPGGWKGVLVCLSRRGGETAIVFQINLGWWKGLGGSVSWFE